MRALLGIVLLAVWSIGGVLATEQSHHSSHQSQRRQQQQQEHHHHQQQERRQLESLTETQQGARVEEENPHGVPNNNNNDNDNKQSGAGDINETDSILSRELSSNPEQCVYDPSLITDAIWYELGGAVTSEDDLDCSDAEWSGIRQEIENTLNGIDLWSDGIRVVELNPHLCNTSPGTGRRKLFLEELAVYIFHLFYRGGGRCQFCSPEDTDANSRRNRRTNVVEGLDGQEEESDETHRSLDGSVASKERMTRRERPMPSRRNRLPPARGGLRSRELDRNEYYKTSTGRKGEVDTNGSNADIDDDEVPDELRLHPRRSLHQQEGQEGTSEGHDEGFSSLSESQGHRKLGCGGCFRLDFSRDKNGNVITGTPYIPTTEYWDSHGVKITTITYGYWGYAPQGQARIYDTSFHAVNDYHGDPDLGSPNKSCPGGGPGYGQGGEPTDRFGNPNPGANCSPIGNVLIVQESNKMYADDCIYGGTIVFEFRYPVTLNSIGLFDVDGGYGNHVNLVFENGDEQRHYVHGMGDNAIEEMAFDKKKVVKAEFELFGPGALRWIDFCHDCGDEEEDRNTAVHGYYPDVQTRAIENQQSVMNFEEALPLINEKLSMEVQTAVAARFYGDPGSCLYRKHVKTNIEIVVSTPIAANSC